MSITLKVAPLTLELHSDLKWSDEFNWHAVEQSKEYSVTGALIVQNQQRLAGRPITLVAPDDSAAWMRRSVVEQLRNWAAVPGQQLELKLRNVTRIVAFRHEEGAALEAEPVCDFSDGDIDGSDFYRCTLRLMEI